MTTDKDEDLRKRRDLLLAHWENYRNARVAGPADAPPVAFFEQTFYAGAMAVFDVLHDDAITDEQGGQAMVAMLEELKAWIDSRGLAHAEAKGNA